jgi:hypothetical protein
VALRPAQPETFVLFGAVHRAMTREATAYPEGAWVTPLGEVPIDAEALEAVRAAGVRVSAVEHRGEHSIEVQLPLLQRLYPDARILPVAAPHDPGMSETGRRIAEALKGLDRRAVVTASTDLTHYGMGYEGAHHGPVKQAMPWMRENDGRIIGMVEALDAESVVDEATRNRNACGAGAVAAALAAAKELGATRGVTLEYTTSADVMGEMYTDRAVGYMAAVLVE